MDRPRAGRRPWPAKYRCAGGPSAVPATRGVDHVLGPGARHAADHVEDPLLGGGAGLLDAVGVQNEQVSRFQPHGRARQLGGGETPRSPPWSPAGGRHRVEDRRQGLAEATSAVNPRDRARTGAAPVHNPDLYWAPGAVQRGGEPPGAPPGRATAAACGGRSPSGPRPRSPCRRRSDGGEPVPIVQAKRSKGRHRPRPPRPKTRR